MRKLRTPKLYSIHQLFQENSHELNFETPYLHTLPVALATTVDRGSKFDTLLYGGELRVWTPSSPSAQQRTC